MEPMPVEFPTPYESERLLLRCYQPGDGEWFYTMSLRNHQHLLRYEAENVVSNVASLAAAEVLVCELAEEWAARRQFFIGAFEKASGEFAAQVYVGPIDWGLPEFQIGYFADVNHEGQGYVTEAVKATLEIIFNNLKAHRVRLECNETNLRSIRVAEHCGMKREGYLRENRHDPNGNYSSSYIYGILSQEFYSGR